MAKKIGEKIRNLNHRDRDGLSYRFHTIAKQVVKYEATLMQIIRCKRIGETEADAVRIMRKVLMQNK